MSSTIESKPSINLSDLQKQIVESVRTDKSLLGKHGALTPLIKHALEAVLEGEIEAHMAAEGEEADNRRNGKMTYYNNIPRQPCIFSSLVSCLDILHPLKVFAILLLDV